MCDYYPFGMAFFTVIVTDNYQVFGRITGVVQCSTFELFSDDGTLAREDDAKRPIPTVRVYIGGAQIELNLNNYVTQEIVYDLIKRQVYETGYLAEDVVIDLRSYVEADVIGED